MPRPVKVYKYCAAFCNNDAERVCGHGDEFERTKLKIQSLGMPPVEISAISCGTVHSVLLSNEGQVYTWGENESGQLGLGGDGLPRATPTTLPFFRENPGQTIAAGGYHTIAVTTGGLMVSWGLGNEGQLGQATHALESGVCNTPKQITQTHPEAMVDIGAGAFHTVYIARQLTTPGSRHHITNTTYYTWKSSPHH